MKQKVLLILFAVSYDLRNIDLFITKYVFVIFINIISYLCIYL